MPAPKMSLNGQSINQPNYGYSSFINTNVSWRMVGENYRGYIKGSPYLTSDFSIYCDQSQAAVFETYFSNDISLNLEDNSGFFPFSPLLNKTTYLVRMQKNEYTNPLTTPWLHINYNISLLYRESDLPTFINEVNPLIEGDVLIHDGNEESTRKKITGIREIALPGELTFNENNNSVLTRSGLPFNIENHRVINNLAGLTSDIEISGTFNKVAKILCFLLWSRNKPFYINTPDYLLFGKKVPMKHYSSGFGFDAYKVVCISNPIEVVHDFLGQFTIKLRLARVV